MQNTIHIAYYIYKDIAALEKSIAATDPENSTLDSFSLEMFENIAYIMAKHADGSIPDTVEDWLDVIEKTVPAKTIEINKKAFLAGYEM